MKAEDYYKELPDNHYVLECLAEKDYDFSENQMIVFADEFADRKVQDQTILLKKFATALKEVQKLQSDNYGNGMNTHMRLKSFVDRNMFVLKEVEEILKQ